MSIVQQNATEESARSIMVLSQRRETMKHSCKVSRRW